MRAAYRYAAIGLAALGALSAGQWLRAHDAAPAAMGPLLGVWPNLAAAVAIPFVVASAWADWRRERPPGRASLVWLVVASAAGLVLWEITQRTSARLVFDWGDIAATFAGSLLAAMLFAALTPRA